MSVRKNLQLLLVVAVLALPGAATAGSFNFDVNGDTAAGGSIYTDRFDWFPDNLLFDGAIPIPASPGETSFTLRAQGPLATFGGTATNLDLGAEMTFVLEVPSVATVVASGGGFDLAIHGTPGGGGMRIYYDDSAGLGTTGGSLANDILGTGYDDGRLIGIAGIAAQDAADFGNIVLAPFNVGTLDQFGADNQLGITTVSVTGNVTYGLEWTFLDVAFFLDGLADMKDPQGADATFTTDTVAPFRNANPSNLVGGVVPNYGDFINDAFCAVTGPPCDLHTEADGRTPFNVDNPQVPEPSTLALLASGLLGVALSERRRRR